VVREWTSRYLTSASRLHVFGFAPIEKSPRRAPIGGAPKKSIFEDATGIATTGEVGTASVLCARQMPEIAPSIAAYLPVFGCACTEDAPRRPLRPSPRAPGASSFATAAVSIRRW